MELGEMKAIYAPSSMDVEQHPGASLFISPSSRSNHRHYTGQFENPSPISILDGQALYVREQYMFGTMLVSAYVVFKFTPFTTVYSVSACVLLFIFAVYPFFVFIYHVRVILRRGYDKQKHGTMKEFQLKFRGRFMMRMFERVNVLGVSPLATRMLITMLGVWACYWYF